MSKELNEFLEKLQDDIENEGVSDLTRPLNMIIIFAKQQDKRIKSLENRINDIENIEPISELNQIR